MRRPPEPGEAAAALDRVDRAGRAVRRGTRWIATSPGLFAAAFAGVTLLLGLLPTSSSARGLISPAWVVLVTLSVMWAQRQPAKSRGLARRTAPYWAGTIALYGVVLFVGVRAYPQRSAFWLPAAAMVAAPMAYGAWREAHR